MANLGAASGASFGGVAFGIVQEKGPSVLLPDEDQNLDVTETNYGGPVYIQDLGQRTTEYTITAIVPLDNWTALRNKRKTTGTLSPATGITYPAYFKTIGGKPALNSVTGYVECSLTFLV